MKRELKGSSVTAERPRYETVNLMKRELKAIFPLEK